MQHPDETIFQRTNRLADESKQRKAHAHKSTPSRDVWWSLFFMAVTNPSIFRIVEINVFGRLAGHKDYVEQRPMTEQERTAQMWREGLIQGCSKCNKVLPKTTQYFYGDGRGKLRTWCKACDNKFRQARRVADRRNER